MRIRAFAAVLCAIALLAGCGGKASSTIPTAPDSATGGPGDRSGSQPRHGGKAKLAIRIRVPRARRAHYVSPATQGIKLNFSGPSSFKQTLGLTPSDPRCSGIPLTCTISESLLPGSYTVAVQTYDQAPVSGSIPQGAKLLSSAANVNASVTAGKANALQLTLDGNVSTFVVDAFPTATIGTALGSPQDFSVTAKDADGYTIVGTYANPVTLANGDSSGATTVATSGSDNPPAGELLGSQDIATIAYNGGAIASATISASAAGATTGQGVFTPVPALTSIGTSSGLIGTQVSETLTGHFVSGATTVNVSGSGVTVSNVVASASSITATLFVDAEASTGARNVTVQVTGGAASAAQTFTISNTGVDVVTASTDSQVGTNPGLCGGAGQTGELRYELCNAAAGDTIVFDTTAMCAASTCSITLAAPLPRIVQDQTIDGGQYGRVTIDGASTYRAFWADSGNITIANLIVQNAKAKGGNGGSQGGGGGAGLGAGLFINTADVVVSNDYFLNDKVAGGNGNPGSGLGGGGGGGMGGDGGGAVGQNGGGGGGGVFSAGSNAGSGSGGAGALDFSAASAGGGAATSGTSSSGGTGNNGATGGGGGGGGADTYSGCNAFTSGGGGAGGFGGGGGGSVYSLSLPNSGGAGGFGGGGGASSSGCQPPQWGVGGTGGPGGGGGAGFAADGGSLGGQAYGGLADDNNGGGGGAAGPAIFVYTGTLTTSNSGESGTSASGGLGPGGGAENGGSDATPVFNYGGTVNGVSVSAGNGGGVSSALGNAAPSMRRHPTKHRTVGRHDHP